MMQIDTKVVVDGLPLPSETYRHLLLKKREGLTFIILVLLWLRAFDIRGKSYHPE
ncbi:MAG: hypothetical protein ABIK81_02550 [candidate division WOR-3 bacterium]